MNNPEILWITETLINHKVYFHTEYKPLSGGTYNFIFYESNIDKADKLFPERLTIKIKDKFAMLKICPIEN